MSLSLKSLVRYGGEAAVGTTAGAMQANMCGKFLYATDDAAATVETAGYFNNARQFLKKGDHIDASMAVSGTPIGGDYIVTASPATGNVTITLRKTTLG